MRFAFTLIIAAIAAVVFSLPWSIAMDLALHHALSQQLGDSSMRLATACIDDTEIVRAIGLVIVLILWSLFVLAVDKGLALIAPKKSRP